MGIIDFTNVIVLQGHSKATNGYRSSQSAAQMHASNKIDRPSSPGSVVGSDQVRYLALLGSLGVIRGPLDPPDRYKPVQRNGEANGGFGGLGP
jgi:hypothetical protein